MDRVNSHTKSYNIPRSFEAIITKLELGWPVMPVNLYVDRLSIFVLTNLTNMISSSTSNSASVSFQIEENTLGPKLYF